LSEWAWNSTGSVELINSWGINLNSNRELNGVRFSKKDGRSWINLDGHTLTLGSLGIISNSPINGDIVNGTLTSSVGDIDITFESNAPDNLFFIGATITNSVVKGSRPVGLTFRRNSPGYDHRGGSIGGDRSNTFSGDVNVLGFTKLNLEKANNAIAVPKNLNIVDGAHVRILRNEQIANTSRVSLISKGSEPSSGLYFVYLGYVGKSEIKESIRELFVDGRGHIDFYQYKDIILATHLSILYLEDLIVTDGSLLTIDNWNQYHAKFLVRKDSKHLNESLGKIKFTGYQTVHKRDYDNDYWEIYAQLPEPSTYGAGLAVLGLGTVALRKRSLARSRES